MSSSVAVSPAAMTLCSVWVTICWIFEVGGVVERKELAVPSDEQINLVHGDLGSFSIIGHSIGVSGVGQLSVLYKGQFLLVE